MFAQPLWALVSISGVSDPLDRWSASRKAYTYTGQHSIESWIVQGSDDGVWQLGFLSFWILSIIRLF
jgi:hypothetical protein